MIYFGYYNPSDNTFNSGSSEQSTVVITSAHNIVTN